MPESLSTIAELGIGIAGFSGVVVALGHGAQGLGPLDRIRVIGLLLYSLGAALLATLPRVITEAGALEGTAWQLSSVLFAAYLGGIALYGLRASRSAPESIRTHLSAGMWFLSVGGALVFALGLAWNASAWNREPSAGPYLAGLYYLLLFASLQFARLLLVRPEDPPAA